MEVEKEKMYSSLNDLRSHPDKLLKVHLNKVGDLSKKILQAKNLDLDDFVEFNTLQEISYLIGITHDFGKATAYFQEYISEPDNFRKEKLKHKPETHHAFISSIFAYYVVKGHLNEKGLLEKEYYRYLPIICFFVVKRHHGNLDNADDEIYNLNEANTEIQRKQVRSIDFDILSEVYANFCSGYTIDIDDFKERFDEIINEIKKDKGLVRQLKDESSLFYYFISLMLYSVLLDSDKTDAANLEVAERRTIQSNIVDGYKEKRFGKTNETNSIKPINRTRKKIYDEVISKIKDLNLDEDKILSLNVPTGMGKTLTSLSFALKLRERIKEERGFCPRIIYSLPFLSVIDQSSKEFAKVLVPLCGVSWESLFDTNEEEQEKILIEKIPSSLLLEHHHLSDLIYKTEDEFENTELERDIGKSLLLIEGWNSEIIVTTFMQFFYSLISNRNRMIRKFHNIINSIVILDEVQAIPHKYWLLLKESIRFFAEHFNTYFILVTATQPLIFDEKKSEIKSLINNKKEYFDALDRIDLIPNLSSMNIKDFKSIIQKEIVQQPSKAFLIVMNTISSSKDIYDSIKKGKEIPNTKIYYLSTNIVPRERLKRIKEIKKRSKERKIVVSTQLIEAGVDIDVDIVYRDFGPLDSINQVAGRCNRNAGENKGIVKIFALEDDRAKKYHEYIYDGFIISKTEKVLEAHDNRIITEPSILCLNDAYFEQIKIGQSDDDSKALIDHAKRLKFAELSSEFRLIENEPYKVDVFVELDDGAAEEVWQKYQEIVNNKELKGFKKKGEFLKIKKSFYDYVISVDEKKAEIIPEVCGFRYISKSQLDDCYDIETGFKGGSDNLSSRVL